jgi:tetratricopeptide (TPR) repeat protein
MSPANTYRQDDRLRLKQITGGHELTALLARLIMLVTITLLPWHFGGVVTGSQVLMLMGVVAALVLVLIRAPDRWYPVPKMMIVLLGALLFGALQLVPLQGSLLKLLSPQAYAYWQFAPNGDRFLELATPEQRDHVQEITAAFGPPRNSLSLFPASTRHDLALLLAAIATFFLAAQLFANAYWQRILFAVVAVNGAVFAFFGIAQKLAWNGMLYGFVPLNQGGLPFAAFVNRNNGACFLNLCLACALGLCVWVAFRQERYSYEPHRRRRHRHRDSNRSESQEPKGSTTRSSRRHRSSDKSPSRAEQNASSKRSFPEAESGGKPTSQAETRSSTPPLDPTTDSAAAGAPSPETGSQPIAAEDLARAVGDASRAVGDPIDSVASDMQANHAVDGVENRISRSRKIDSEVKDGLASRESSAERSHRTRRGAGSSMQVARPSSVSSPSTLKRRILLWIAQLDGPILYIVLAVGFILAGLLFALSRGGWVSTLAGTVALLVILTFTKTTGTWSWAVPTAMFFSLGLMVWLGQSEAVETRFASLQAEFEQPRDGRLEHWQDALRAAADFWFLGSGIGTYRVVYPIYTDSDQQTLFYHGENQYIEALLEGGLVGLALLLTSLIAVGVSCYRLLLQKEDSNSLVCGIVGLFLLVSQTVHACFDFGLYLTANTQLLAVLCGAIVGRDVRLRSRDDYRDQPPIASRFDWTTIFTKLHAAVTVFLITCGIAGILELQSLEAVEIPYFQALKPVPENASIQKTIDLTERDSRQFDEAIPLRADDAEAQLLRAELMTTYRRLLQFAAGADKQKESSLEVFWLQTSPALAHASFLDLLRSSKSSTNAGLDTSELQVFTEAWISCLQAYYAALAACPLLADGHLRVAQLEPFVVQEPTSQSHLAHARQLAGGRAQLWAEIGFAELQIGDTHQATSDLRKSLQLSGRDPAPLIRALSQSLPPLQAVSVAPDRPELLAQLAQEQFTSQAEQPLRMALLERAAELLKQSDGKTAEAAYARGILHLDSKNTQNAAKELQSAVDAQPDRIAWRYELAKVLLDMNDYERALEQASACFHANPSVKEYDDLRRAIIRQKLLHTP